MCYMHYAVLIFPSLIHALTYAETYIYIVIKLNNKVYYVKAKVLIEFIIGVLHITLYTNTKILTPHSHL